MSIKSLVWIVVLGMLAVPSLALVPNPGAGFHGQIVHNGEFAQVGTSLVVLFRDGTVCGDTVIESVGVYELVCIGSVSRAGEPVHFRINNDMAYPSAEYIPGKVFLQNLYSGDEETARRVFREAPQEVECEGCLLRLVLYAIIPLFVVCFSYTIIKWIRSS